MIGKSTELRWIETGIAAGIAASALYPLILFAPLPFVATVTLAALLGPAIGAASLGLRALLRLGDDSVASTLGAVSNLLAGALFTAMVLVQLAVRHGQPPAADGLVGVWLGLDVAWDVYIGLGTLCFAWAAARHPRFGWRFALPGLAIGALVVALNLWTFPTPPAEAGSVDVGPLVGLWYLAATVQSWRSLGWARERTGTPPA
ncbi:MAG: hypothetical protein OES32_07130 [Acidobacteriota bacterium]|nr:hypothetical protein [Acidobacteriota bacterium]MDH3523344.1 hypothetical protein [Acidobacteriota bacterium]